MWWGVAAPRPDLTDVNGVQVLGEFDHLGHEFVATSDRHVEARVPT